MEVKVDLNRLIKDFKSASNNFNNFHLMSSIRNGKVCCALDIIVLNVTKIRIFVPACWREIFQMIFKSTAFDNFSRKLNSEANANFTFFLK